MEVEFKASEKMVYIWLTKADAENAQLRESLKPFYQKCKSNGVLCAVFISGPEDLREGIRDLLLYNKYRLDEIEYRKTHKDDHFFHRGGVCTKTTEYELEAIADSATARDNNNGQRHDPR